MLEGNPFLVTTPEHTLEDSWESQVSSVTTWNELRDLLDEVSVISDGQNTLSKDALFDTILGLADGTLSSDHQLPTTSGLDTKINDLLQKKDGRLHALEVFHDRNKERLDAMRITYARKVVERDKKYAGILGFIRRHTGAEAEHDAVALDTLRDHYIQSTRADSAGYAEWEKTLQTHNDHLDIQVARKMYGAEMLLKLETAVVQEKKKRAPSWWSKVTHRFSRTTTPDTGVQVSFSKKTSNSEEIAPQEYPNTLSNPERLELYDALMLHLDKPNVAVPQWSALKNLRYAEACKFDASRNSLQEWTEYISARMQAYLGGKVETYAIGEQEHLVTWLTRMHTLLLENSERDLSQHDK